jgi:Spy/CpxP family protein refolding chaperone
MDARRHNFVLIALMAVAATCWRFSAAARAEDPHGEASRPHAAHHLGRGTLEDRVRLLTKALELSPKQQEALRQVLERQRADVMKIWADDAIPAPYRVSATQAISDRAADDIRALLNEEQKKKYNPPKPPRDALQGDDRPNVESLMYPKKAQ